MKGNRRRAFLAEGQPDDVRFVMTVREGDVVELWLREEQTNHELAELLRSIADGFETGDVKRVR